MSIGLLDRQINSHFSDTRYTVNMGATLIGLQPLPIAHTSSHSNSTQATFQSTTPLNSTFHNARDDIPSSTAQVQDNLQPVTKNRQILVLISAFFTVLVTIGFNQAYGVFQSYYTSPSQTMLSPSARDQPAFVAFVGTLGYGLTWAGSIFVNPLMARMGTTGVRWICIAGVLLMSLGFALASISTQIWQLLLTQGLLFGIGASMLYFPILASAPEYFSAHRGAAMGVILSGAGIGGLIMAPSIRALLTAIGPRWTLRFMAFLNLVISLPIAVTAAPSRFVGRRKTHLDWNLAKKPAFVLSAAAAFLTAGGNGVPMTFIADYSITVGYSASFGATLLALNNGINSISRIGMGWTGDRFGRQNTVILTVSLCALLIVTLWLSSVATSLAAQQALWIAFVASYGFASGGYNALFPTTIAEVFGIQNYSSVSGFLYFVRGCGAMFGSPVAGKVLGRGALVEKYKGVVWYDFALFGAAALAVLGVRWWDARGKGIWSWKA